MFNPIMARIYQGAGGQPGTTPNFQGTSPAGNQGPDVDTVD